MRTNVIWIFGDQHRGQALGYRGDPNVATPRLDALAEEGVSYDRAITNCPLCSPARGTLLTGRYPHAAVSGHQRQLDPKQPTIAHAFNDAGYHTAYFGKWHLDGFDEATGLAGLHEVPKERRGGFQQWLGYENNNAPWDCRVHGDHPGYQKPTRLQGFETDALTDLFIEHLEGRAEAGSPFFASLSVQPPHDPYLAPAGFNRGRNAGSIVLRANVPPIARCDEQARRELSGYYSSIENLDYNVGRIVDALDQTRLADDTIIMFFSDHGDQLGSHGQFRKTGPFQESLSVPLIISGQRKRYKYMYPNSGHAVSLVDLVPTTLSLCDLPIPGWVQGSDFSATFARERSTPPPPVAAFFGLFEPTGHPNSMDRAFRGVISGDGWKYVVVEGSPFMLHNLNEDPYEQANHVFNPCYSEERERLHGMLKRHLDKVSDPFVLPR